MKGNAEKQISQAVVVHSIRTSAPFVKTASYALWYGLGPPTKCVYRNLKSDGAAENQSPEPNLSPLPPQHTVFSKTLHLKPLRQLSCFLPATTPRKHFFSRSYLHLSAHPTPHTPVPQPD